MILFFVFYSSFTFSLGAFSAESVRIVFLGDSLTAGYGVAKESAYPSLVEKLLQEKGHEVEVINAGISGSTTASALSRLKWQLRSPFQVLVLALGANDGLRGLSVGNARKNLSKTIELAKSKNIKVLLVGMKMPKNYGKRYRQGFSEMFPKLAKEHEVLLMPFLLDGVGGVKELNQPDGIHPNEKGYKVISQKILPYIERLL